MARRKITEQKIEISSDDLPDLTAQQLKFVEGILSGKTASDSYRAAYDCSNMQPNSIWAEASRLRSNPNVSSWLSMAKIAGLERSGLNREQYIAELRSAAEEARKSGNHGARMQALKYLGEVLGYYTERLEIVSNDPKDLLAEIALISPEAAKALADKEWPGATEH